MIRETLLVIGGWGLIMVIVVALFEYFRPFENGLGESDTHADDSPVVEQYEKRIEPTLTTWHYTASRGALTFRTKAMLLHQAEGVGWDDADAQARSLCQSWGFLPIVDKSEVETRSHGNLEIEQVRHYYCLREEEETVLEE